MWVLTQREDYKHKRMRQERLNLLENIGFVWNMKKAYWNEMYQKLKEYKEQHGHYNIKKVRLYLWMIIIESSISGGNLI